MAKEVTKTMVNGAEVTTTTYDGKGAGMRDSTRRKCTPKQFAKNWDRTFGKAKREPRR